MTKPHAQQHPGPAAQADTSPLHGRRAMVTGGARGIGRAVALCLARAGADVAVTDVDLRSFDEFPREREQMTADTVAEEVAALGRRALQLQADATDADAMARAFDEVDAAWGGVDVLVNNAGGATLSHGEQTTASNATLDSLHTNLARNLTSTVIGCQLAVPRMRAANGGAIVNMASQAAYKWENKPYAFYGAAKAGVVAYTKYLAEEVGADRIRVNAIAPGFIGTGRMLPLFEGRGLDAIVQRVALGRLGTPEDCAQVAAFLAGDAAAYISGQVLKVTGGPYV